jgi:hypothetical protein
MAFTVSGCGAFARALGCRDLVNRPDSKIVGEHKTPGQAHPGVASGRIRIHPKL